MTYTKIESVQDSPPERMVYTSTVLNYTQCMNETTCLYKDYGINCFDNFTHYLEFKIEHYEYYPDICLWAMSNNASDIGYLDYWGIPYDPSNSQTYIWVDLWWTSGIALRLREDNMGSRWWSTNLYATLGTTYYITVQKNGSTLTLSQFSDSARLSLIGSTSLSLHGGDEKYRYIYACAGMGRNPYPYSATPGSWGQVIIANLKGVSSGLDSVGLGFSCDLENINGTFWVFTNWKYYTFTLRLTFPYANTSLVDAGIRFSVDVESLGNVTAEFIISNSSQNVMSWEYSSDAKPVDITRFGEPLLLQTGAVTQNTSLIYDVTFPIFFEKQCLDLWTDAIDVYGACNATNAGNVTWTLLQANVFYIYSRGGFSMNYGTSNAAKAYLMAGGTPFSFYARNGTIVYNEIWYRDVQHVKLLPDIGFLTGDETFELQYGIDYVVAGANTNWVTGWMAQIMPYTVSYTGFLAGNVWINMTVNFKNREVWQTSTPVYMFYHGSVNGPGDPGHFKAWVDLWFSDTNASSTGAARVNAYEYPMKDNADLWLRWLSNNWGVKDDVSKEAQIEIPLLDYAGYPISAGKVKMMRVWSRLIVEDANAGQQITLKNFEAWDLTHSRELPLSGIPAPVFDETKIPTVGQSGILGAIYSLFAGLGQWLSENMLFGGLNLWGNFVAFLDTISSWFGAPHFFTDLFSWLGSGMGWMGSGMTYIFTLIYDIFLLFGSLMTGFLSTIAQLIVSIVNTITFFTNIMSGAIGGAGNLWDQLGISSWITVALIFYPIYLIILWEEKGMDAVISQLSMIFGILSWMFSFFYQLGTMFISFIHTLIESIPVVE